MPTPRDACKVSRLNRCMTPDTLDGTAEAAAQRARRNQLGLSRFSRWYRAEGMSETTVEHRLIVLRQVAAFLDERGTALDDATEEQLREWRYQLDVSPRTAAGYISGLHVYYGAYLVETEECRPDDPSRRLKRPRRVKLSEPNPITEGEVYLILEAAQIDPELFAILMLMRYAGLRSVEVSRLRVADVEDREDGGLWLRVHGKGDRWRKIPAAAEIRVALAPFRRTQGWLFTTPDGAQWRPREISRRVSLHIRSLAIGHTAHHLRHSFATRTLAVEPNIRKLQLLMGHANLESTAIYTRVEPADLAEVVDLMTSTSTRRRRRGTARSEGVS